MGDRVKRQLIHGVDDFLAIVVGASDEAIREEAGVIESLVTTAITGRDDWMARVVIAN